MRDEYTKAIDLKVNVDTSAFEEASKNLSLMQVGFTEDEKKAIQDKYVKEKELLLKIQTLKQAISELSLLSGGKDSNKMAQLTTKLKELEQEKTAKGIKTDEELEQEKKAGMSLQTALKSYGKSSLNFFEQQAKQVFSEIKTFVVDLFKDALSELQDMASYDLGSSLFQNSTAREQALTYGLSNDQNYALTKTMSALGLNSEEDLMYMNDTQKTEFQKLMTKYAEKYNSLSDSGFFDTIEDFTLEWQQFKEDLQYDVMEWFVNNKDTIMNVMKFAMTFMENMLSAIGTVIDLIDLTDSTSEDRLSNVDSIIDKYKVSASSDVSSTSFGTTNYNTTSTSTVVNGLDISTQSIGKQINNDFIQLAKFLS